MHGHMAQWSITRLTKHDPVRRTAIPKITMPLPSPVFDRNRKQP